MAIMLHYRPCNERNIDTLTYLIILQKRIMTVTADVIAAGKKEVVRRYRIPQLSTQDDRNTFDFYELPGELAVAPFFKRGSKKM